MLLHLLPTRHANAAENMATDFLLLQRYPEPAAARFRHYGWHRPAFTFGYSQKIAYIRAQLPADETVELCRRPSGGGLVDHRHDWTYTLVIPRGHTLYDARAIDSYRAIHAALADALVALGQPAKLQDRCPSNACANNSENSDSLAPDSSAKGPTICFNRAELHDVIHPDTQAKIAGAAQKRSKHGLLFQGSLARSSVSPTLDTDALADHFATRLATALQATLTPTPWPELNEDELSALTEQYGTPDWNEFR